MHPEPLCFLYGYTRTSRAQPSISYHLYMLCRLQKRTADTENSRIASTKALLLHQKSCLRHTSLCAGIRQLFISSSFAFKPLVLYHQLYDFIICFLHTISCQLTNPHDGFLNIAANYSLSTIKLLPLLIHHAAHDPGINRS